MTCGAVSRNSASSARSSTKRDGGFGGGGFDIAVVFESLGRGLVVEPFLDTLMVGRARLRAAATQRSKTLHRRS